MKKLNILKTLLDVFWVFSIIGIIGLALFIPFMFFSDEAMDIPIKINGEKILVIDWTTRIILVLGVIAYCFFVYAIYQLRKLLVLFSNRIIFDEKIILLLHQVGLNFMFASFLTGIPALIYNVRTKGDMAVEFGGGFSSFLFTASLGLFFMVLSEVFKMAKTMKEENELTI
ncbi:DUF2975 domain-containing protein [Flavobacterium sp. GT3R68]|uniref:DUF2975 domain-containing protein n=1 Tax=Flavobacterium sp. GT3R68 TaxID=2594437 RepID=UPI000F872F11|nr:DUF2975 domain-containing protein [Flavobacterium sp. GT3R68]RTY90863.1 DUF2975 domain-containing protein [Flavobacterium sp. GSN2]TRW93856.1 DUF2975 domain-containing protein [Flavobacterium sp. GT3R68]